MKKYDVITHSIISDEIFDNSNLNMGRIVPIYPLSENLNMKTLRKAVFNALEMFKNTIKTVLPEDICKKYNIMDKKDAVFQMHFYNPDYRMKKHKCLSHNRNLLLQLGVYLFL